MMKVAASAAIPDPEGYVMQKKFRMGKLEWLCCMVYFTSYITRINYAACLAEIVVDMNVTKQLASIAVTGSFITYGVGQIVSGVIGDKFSPRRIIQFGLIATSIVNLLMVFLPTIEWMTGFWFFNGFFQALIWPPLVRLMVENMGKDEYAHALFTVSAAASVATIFIYMLVPAAIELAGWRLAFLLCGATGLAVSMIWIRGTVGIKEGNAAPVKAAASAGQQDNSCSSGSLLLWLAPVLICIVLQGTLRDGITTWMPTYISEVFNLGTSVSILTSAILPVFTIISLRLSTWLNKQTRNELKTSFLLFAVGLAAALLLNVFFSRFMPLEVLLISVLSACMHGVNLMLIGQVPAFFARFGKVSTFSGVLNACTYIGSALSTYGFAVLSDMFGWSFTIISWCAIALLGTVLTLGFIKPWTKFRSEA